METAGFSRFALTEVLIFLKENPFFAVCKTNKCCKLPLLQEFTPKNNHDNDKDDE